MRTHLTALAIFLAAATGAAAQTAPSASQAQPTAGDQAVQPPLASKDSESTPALRYLAAAGVKLTYLGNDGGLRGYLGESSGGKMQTFYVTPDGEHFIAGVLFKRGGTNVTGVQIGEMQKRFEDAKKAAQGGAQAPAATAPTQPSAPAGEPAKQDAPAADPEKRSEAAPETSFSPILASAEAPATLAEALPAVALDASDDFVSSISAADFEARAAQANWFPVGKEEAPAIYMVADPQCPWCHAAWAQIRPLVFSGKLQIRVVMIAGLKGSDPIARAILSQANPGQAWLRGEGSTEGVGVSPGAAEGSAAWADAGKYLENNMNFASGLGAQGTPFFAYVGKDQKVHVSEGMPQPIDAFLSWL
jgi:protein-disulfide isomerase